MDFQFVATVFIQNFLLIAGVAASSALAFALLPRIVEVEENTVKIIEKFGRYYKIIEPGYSLLWNRVFVRVAAKVNMAPLLYDSEFETRTPDNAFSKMKVTLECKVSDPRMFYYDMPNPKEQLDALIKDEFLKRMARTGLVEFFLSRDSCCKYIMASLQKRLSLRGLTITEIIPDVPDPGADVKNSFARVIIPMAKAKGMKEAIGVLVEAGIGTDQATAIAMILQEPKAIKVARQLFLEKNSDFDLVPPRPKGVLSAGALQEKNLDHFRGIFGSSSAALGKNESLEAEDVKFNPPDKSTED